MRRYFFFILIVFAISILACDLATPEAKPVPVTEIAEIETTIAPTATPILTPTPVPTPTLVMLTCTDIEKKRKELTDLQWEAYIQEIIGEQIRFAGKILEVYDDGRVQISEGKGLFTGCTLHEIPLDVALTLNKDQYVKGEGTIREIDTFMGLMIRINVESLE